MISFVSDTCDDYAFDKISNIKNCDKYIKNYDGGGVAGNNGGGLSNTLFFVFTVVR